ncbi:hypothetical protein JCM10207_008600 [Rhodosporidiobolus poonsookiae]
MPSLDTLPPELVEQIVALAVPPFEPWHWKQRSSTLRALSLTCKTTSVYARRLLHRQIVLTSPQTGQDYARTLLALPSAERPIVQQLEIRSPLYSTPDWRATAAGTDFPLLPLILHRAAGNSIKLDHFERVTPSASTHALQAEELLLSTLLLEPLLPPLVHTNLRRLGLYHVDCTAVKHLLRPEVLPNLVTLAINLVRTGFDPPLISSNAARQHYIHPSYNPLLCQLRAFSSKLPFLCPPDASYRLLDAYLSPEFLHTLPSLPTSLCVLRLVTLADNYIRPSLADLAAALDLPSFRPALQELHVINSELDGTVDEPETAAIRAWCKRKSVRLVFDDPGDLDEVFDPSFWRSLDDVHGRLGLDV